MIFVLKYLNYVLLQILFLCTLLTSKITCGSRIKCGITGDSTNRRNNSQYFNF